MLDRAPHMPLPAPARRRRFGASATLLGALVLLAFAACSDVTIGPPVDNCQQYGKCGSGKA